MPQQQEENVQACLVVNPLGKSYGKSYVFWKQGQASGGRWSLGPFESWIDVTSSWGLTSVPGECWHDSGVMASCNLDNLAGQPPKNRSEKLLTQPFLHMTTHHHQNLLLCTHETSLQSRISLISATKSWLLSLRMAISTIPGGPGGAGGPGGPGGPGGLQWLQFHPGAAGSRGHCSAAGRLPGPGAGQHGGLAIMSKRAHGHGCATGVATLPLNIDDDFWCCMMMYVDLWGLMMTSAFIAHTYYGRYEIEAMAFQRLLRLRRILKNIQPMCEHVEWIEQVCSNSSAHP